MRVIVGLLALICAQSAHATLMQLEFDDMFNGHFGGGTYDMTMLVETGAFIREPGFAVGSSGVSCLTSFGGDATLRSFSTLHSSGAKYGTSGAFEGVFGGSGPPPCSGYFSGMGFQTDVGFLRLIFDYHAGLTEEAFHASHDPLATILMTLPIYGGLTAELFTDDGYVFRLGGPPSNFRAFEVPEPSSLALMSIALLGLFARRRRV